MTYFSKLSFPVSSVTSPPRYLCYFPGLLNVPTHQCLSSSLLQLLCIFPTTSCSTSHLLSPSSSLVVSHTTPLFIISGFRCFPLDPPGYYLFHVRCLHFFVHL
ncbi:hypothetical protein GOODEAATRI_005603 [Goodea atripinnis]|uniref:Uncharacterized protein n=1 Tax=Goodea atripinnis TaxID=208336 RepID=A0ABV0NAL6_9TELE